MRLFFRGRTLTNKVIKFLRFFGLNRAIGYGVLARAWSFIAGPVTILIIASRFSKEQQGFYYTISSLLALQIFFELGLVTVLAQFASHEFAHLTWGAKGRIEGDPIARERLIDLLCKATKWFGIAALLLIVVLVPAGIVFLNQQDVSATDFSWRLPWILAVCGIAVNLLIVPFSQWSWAAAMWLRSIIGKCWEPLSVPLYAGLLSAFTEGCMRFLPLLPAASSFPVPIW